MFKRALLPTRALTTGLQSTTTIIRHASTGPRFFSASSSSSRPRPKLESSTSTNPNDSSSTQTFRRVVLTGAVALIVVVGSITGARIKTDSDTSRQHKVVLELPLDDRIAMLEDRRAGLVAMKIPLERKLKNLRERMAGQKKEGATQESEKEA